MILLRRLGLWLAIYALDLQIDGTTATLDHITDPVRRGRMEIARHHARAERARLRAAYNATFPPGRRRTWSVA